MNYKSGNPKGYFSSLTQSTAVQDTVVADLPLSLPQWQISIQPSAGTGDMQKTGTRVCPGKDAIY